MSDALCGPSNALQQFKQHTHLDRTLQQDRLVSRHSPSQGFRSHNPNAAFLDAEFDAFQAGMPPPELASFKPSPHPLAAPVNTAAPPWVTDFQRLQVSAPSPVQQLQQSPGPSTKGWVQSFGQQLALSAPRAQAASTSSPQAFQYQARYGGLSGYQCNFVPAMNSPMNFGAPETTTIQGKGKEPVFEQFDDAAFERAFDSAMEDLQAERAGSPTSYCSAPEFDDDDGLFSTPPNELAHELQPQMDLGVQNTAQEQPAAVNDDDALAATAQELLLKIEHNQTDKFRNSQFLGLMRKLRDREVRVEGDKMVETMSAVVDEALGMAPQIDLNTAAVQAPAPPRFDNSEQRPFPLSPLPAVVTRPVEVQARQIPPFEQDLDSGRMIDPRDGQEVVDILNQPLTEDMGESADFP